MQDTSPLFFALYNKNEPRVNKKRLSYPALFKIVKEAVQLAGKNLSVTFHWFRHTFVIPLLENDVHLAVVKDRTGHSDVSTTNIYLERINCNHKTVSSPSVVASSIVRGARQSPI
ncbi:site-specific integrase [Neobacillus cucumis]|uniref:site-specific integrase n=1 Tax=Neobacillus cucumis TaxID=1740721 RepID=UPI0018DF3A5A|nr:site-specific integrase [Neobacillus cucumis]MBI0579453.1 site-specific integrase [Neobacillus cucumis]